MTPTLSRAGNLRTLESEIRSTVRGLARMAPVALANHPALLEQLVTLADGIAQECSELENQHAVAA